MFLQLTLYLKPHHIETKYAFETEMHWRIVTMESSQKLCNKTILLSLLVSGKVICTNTVFGSLHRSKNAPFVYILNAEYSDNWKGTYVNDISSLTTLI